MASSRRTFDTDSITLRTVYAKNGNNTNIPALRALTADGSGGTTWRIPSSFGTVPSFNQIITDAGTFTADLSYNTFRLTSGEGIGTAAGPAGSNQIFLYSKAFGQVDVSGADSLYSYSNGVINRSFQIAATNGLQLRSDPQSNILYIDGPLTTTISSGYYAFNKFLVVPSISTFIPNIPTSQGNFLIANSPSTQITFAGVGDVILSSFYSTNTVYFTVSSYSAAEFLAISSVATGLFSNITSTLSNLYVTKFDFSTGTTSVSTNSYSNTSSLTSTIYGISSFFVTQFNILTGLINARATIAQLNSNVNSFQTAISSFSTNYIENSQYISSTQGIINQVSSVVTISNVSSIYLFGGTIYNFSTGSILYDQSDVSTLSTAAGVSISTTSNGLLNQLIGNYLSTQSTVNNLGTLGFVSTLSLTSTIQGLGTFQYISTQSLVSTVVGIGGAGYVSTSFLDSALASTTKGVNDNFGSFNYISALTLQSSLQSTTKGIIDSLGSIGYVSTPSLNSTLQSTVKGVNDYLGFYSYISSQGLGVTLASTVGGLGTIGYTSTPTLDFVLVSTNDSFTSNISTNFISTVALNSTTAGLGTVGYISTAQLVSTTSSLLQIASSVTKISLQSSIRYDGNNGSISASLFPPTSQNLFFNTAQLSLAPFSSYVLASSRINLTIDENILFDTAESGSVGSIKYLSSYITAPSIGNLLILSNGTISDPVILQFSNTSNLYAKTLTYSLNTQQVINSYTSTLTIGHYISSGLYDSASNLQGFNSSNLTIANSSTNSIFVTILN